MSYRQTGKFSRLFLDRFSTPFLGREADEKREKSKKLICDLNLKLQYGPGERISCKAVAPSRPRGPHGSRCGRLHVHPRTRSTS